MGKWAATKFQLKMGLTPKWKVRNKSLSNRKSPRQVIHYVIS